MLELHFLPLSAISFLVNLSLQILISLPKSSLSLSLTYIYAVVPFVKSHRSLSWRLCTGSSAMGDYPKAPKKDPFLLNFDTNEVRIAAEFLSNWLPFLSRGLCKSCTQTLSDGIRSLHTGVYMSYNYCISAYALVNLCFSLFCFILFFLVIE